MSDTRFTNRELSAMFDGIKEKLDEHAETHSKILEQVTYTNGKVRRLYLIVAAVAGMSLANPDSVLSFLKFAI